MKTPKQYLIDRIEECSGNQLDQYLKDVSKAIYERISDLKENQQYTQNDDQYNEYEMEISRLYEIDRVIDTVITEYEIRYGLGRIIFQGNI